MSIEGIDPIAELQPDASPDDAREIAAALVRQGTMGTEDANELLVARGAVPLSENSLEQLQSQKARLMRDPDFQKAAANGDPDYIHRLAELNARIARATGKLTDQPVEPATAYRFPTASRPEFRDMPDKEIIATDAALTEWAQSLHLSPSVAAGLMQDAWDADAMPADQREARALKQEQIFARAVGPDYDARIAAANTVLREISGRQLDLKNVIRTAGARAAVTLLHQADHLAATRKAR